MMAPISLPAEQALAPEIEICDAHHHLWITEHQTYLLPEIQKDLDCGHHITRTVFIEWKSHYRDTGPQELKPVGETEFAAAVGSASEGTEVDVCSAIVGFADLALGDAVAPVLESHVQAGKGRFRGVRYVASWDDDQAVVGHAAPGRRGVYRDRNFLDGISALQRMGLSFDAWLYQTQIDDLIILADRFPKLPIVMNHTGGVLGVGRYVKDRQAFFDQWRTGLESLSRRDNVFLKLGGLGMFRSGLRPTAIEGEAFSETLCRTWAPWLLEAIDTFGPDRCMFESNFPVDRDWLDYGTVWNCFKRCVGSFSENEKHALFAGTANSFYRLGLAAH